MTTKANIIQVNTYFLSLACHWLCSAARKTATQHVTCKAWFVILYKTKTF